MVGTFLNMNKGLKLDATNGTMAVASHHQQLFPKEGLKALPFIISKQMRLGILSLRHMHTTSSSCALRRVLGMIL